jgi:hypothetical protein
LYYRHASALSLTLDIAAKQLLLPSVLVYFFGGGAMTMAKEENNSEGGGGKETKKHAPQIILKTRKTPKKHRKFSLD